MKITRHTDTPDVDYLERLAAEYLKAKNFAEAASKRADDLKRELSKLTETYGLEDDKGSLWLDAGPIKLKRERRVSRSLDVAAAEAWAKSEGLWEDISVTIQQVSEDKLMQLAWETPEYSESVAKLYSERVVWALKATEQKGSDHGEAE